MQKRRPAKSPNPRPRHSFRPKSYRVVCAGCGKEVLIQIQPPAGKKLFCVECFKL